MKIIATAAEAAVIEQALATAIDNEAEKLPEEGLGSDWIEPVRTALEQATFAKAQPDGGTIEVDLVGAGVLLRYLLAIEGGHECCEFVRPVQQPAEHYFEAARISLLQALTTLEDGALVR